MLDLVDVNSFYTSCETVFRPDLWGKPVVVLSNNDGCVIARSEEAKKLGLKMDDPDLKCKIFPISWRGLLQFQLRTLRRHEQLDDGHAGGDEPSRRNILNRRGLFLPNQGA